MPVLALAELAVIALALIVLCALVLFRKVFVAVIPDWSIPFLGNLRNKVNSIFTAAIHGVWGFADAAIGDLWHVIILTGEFFANFGETLWHYAEEAYKTVAWTVTTYIPREIGNLRAWTKTEVTKLDHKISTAITRAEHYTDTHIVDLAHTVAADLTKAERFAVTEFDKAVKTANGVLTKAEHYAVSEARDAETAAKAAATAALNAATLALHTAITTVSSAVGALEDQVKADVTAIDHAIAGITSTSIPAVITDIDGIIEGAVGAGAAAVGAAVAGAEAAIGTDLADVGAWFGELDLTDVTSIAGLTSLALATVGTLSQLAEDCIVPNCKNVSGLGNLLKDLFGALESGALLAFLVELADDPAQAADDIDSILGTIADDAVGTFRSLLGV